jgi:inhibitor of KinA sporulation pathway (predicted exonuclease)
MVIVIDIEATCWPRNPPAGMVNEIIEIGICRLDVATGHRQDPTAILVKPVRSTVSAFCTRLTTLTPADVEAGVSYAEACQMLIDKYDTMRYPWASWGHYDRRMFEQQAQAFDVPYPFGGTHYNIKQLYADLERGGKPCGMKRALGQLGFELEGTHHRGVDDAWNIARILGHLLSKHGPGILDQPEDKL